MSVRAFVWFLVVLAIGAFGGGFVAFSYVWLVAVGRI